MSILKSTNSGGHQPLTLERLKEFGYERQGIGYLHKIYDWGEDINDSYEDVEVEIKIVNTDLEDNNKTAFVGKLSKDVIVEGCTYTMTTVLYLETVMEFLIYKRGIIKKIDFSDPMFDCFRAKETTYSEIILKQ